MRKRSKLDATTGAAALIAALIGGNGSTLAGEVDPMDFTMVERGRYLSILSDCASCHTVPQKSQPFAGGRPIETPFGAIVAPNITPDLQTGIGAWTDDQFDSAVRHGIGRNGERLYSAMPFNAYTQSQIDLHLGHVARELSGRKFLVGDDLTAADIHLTFTLQAARRSKLLDPYPELLAYLDRMEAREAYKRGVEKGGPFTLKIGG